MTTRHGSGSPGTIVLGGAVAQRPGRGGHAWVFLQYLLGFRQLGWDVLFVDRLGSEMCLDPAGEPARAASSSNAAWFVDLMRCHGLEESFALFDGDGRVLAGRSRPDVLATVERAAAVINVMGYLDDPEIRGRARRLVFLDIDPGFGQMWCALGLHDPFAGHDAFVTIGENMGAAACRIPTCGHDWITTKQPVVLDEWSVTPLPAEPRFTSIGSWRGPNAPIEFEGTTYGLRVHELRRFASLPSLTGAPFELALDIHPDDARDLEMLRGHDWKLVDPDVAATTASYQRYVQGSAAELMVAKGMYVQTSSGWFSDRSICYLASGRPVIAQDTGLAGHVPTGDGLLTFDSLETAAAAVDEVWSNLPRHAKAARELAADVFDARVVLPELLGRLGIA